MSSSPGASERQERGQDLTWEIEIPLVTNGRLVRTVAVVAALAALVPFVFLAVVFGSQGDWRAVATMAKIFGLVGLGLLAAMLLVMALVFRNRIRVRYTVSQRGITQETVDRTATVGSRLAVLAGAVGRSPATAGSGLLAMSRESESIEWDGAFRLAADPRGHVLSFRNAWRTLLDVYCTPGNYDDVAATVSDYMAAHGTATRVTKGWPLRPYVAHSALILAATFAILAICQEYDLDLLAPIVTVAFALATLWLVPLFGYVVFVGIAWLLFSLARVLLSERTSVFGGGQTYRFYEVLSSADWAALLVFLLALGYLTWLAWRSVRGRLVSLLMRDAADMYG